MVLSGVLPRELSDLLAVSILELASLEAVLLEVQLFATASSWVLALLAPLTGALAALSNSSKRQREELALFAYGGSPLQIQGRYVVRGVIISLLGLLPLLIDQLVKSVRLSPQIMGTLTLALVAAIVYAIPGYYRTRSLGFVEQYKG